MKKILSLILLIMVFIIPVSVVKAESLDLDDVFHSGNNNSSVQLSIATKDGGVAGIGTLPKDELNDDEKKESSSSYSVLFKYNKDHTLEWRYVLPRNYSIIDIVEDANGNFLLLTFKISTLHYFSIYHEPYILKITADGKELDNIKLNSPYTSLKYNQMIVDEDNNIYIFGVGKNIEITKEDSTSYTDHVTSYLVFSKYNSNYELEWYKNLNEIVWESNYNKAGGGWADGTSKEGDLVFAEDNGDIIFVSKNNTKYFKIYRYKKDGTKVYEKSFGGETKEDVLLDIVSTADGGAVVAGNLQSTDYTLEVQGSSDIIVIKIDKSGNIEWERTIGSSGFDYVEFLGKTINGYVIVGNAMTELEELGNQKGQFLMKLNKNGETTWAGVLGYTPGYDAFDYYEDTVYIGGSPALADSFPNIEKLTNPIYQYVMNYSIKVVDNDGENKIVVDESAKYNELITIKALAKDGYKLDSISGIKVTKVDDETYTFVMPAQDLELTPVFIEIDDVKNPETGVFAPTIEIGVLAIIALIVLKISKKYHKLTHL